MKSNTEIAIQVSWISILSNLCLAALKWVVGYFGNSYALIADAIESTGDIFSSVLVLFGIKYAHRPPDKNHPYGHGRLEPLITFIVVAFLVTSAVWIALTSIKNIQTPHEIPKSFTLIFLAIVILGKELLFRIITKRTINIKSSSLKADAWHHRSDAITSLAAFIGISIAIILGKGYESADDWAALFASFIILYNSYLIFRPALSEIMDEHLYDDLILEIRNSSKAIPGILGTEKCLVRKHGSNFLIDLHIIVDGQLTVHEGHRIAHELKAHLQQEIPHIKDVLIHVEPDV
ncbi:MAG: cation diffusion facilitator family transporter [Saprospiraceae bacterium]